MKNRFDDNTRKTEDEAAQGMTATEANKRKIVDYLRDANPLDTVNDILNRVKGVAYSTYLRWRREDDDFKEKTDELLFALKEKVIDAVQKELFSAILIPDYEMSKVKADLAKTVVKTLGKDRGFTEKIEMHTEGEMTMIPIQYITPMIEDINDQQTIELNDTDDEE